MRPIVVMRLRAALGEEFEKEAAERKGSDAYLQKSLLQQQRKMRQDPMAGSGLLDDGPDARQRAINSANQGVANRQRMAEPPEKLTTRLINGVPHTLSADGKTWIGNPDSVRPSQVPVGSLAAAGEKGLPKGEKAFDGGAAFRPEFHRDAGKFPGWAGQAITPEKGVDTKAFKGSWGGNELNINLRDIGRTTQNQLRWLESLPSASGGIMGGIQSQPKNAFSAFAGPADKGGVPFEQLVGTILSQTAANPEESQRLIDTARDAYKAAGNPNVDLPGGDKGFAETSYGNYLKSAPVGQTQTMGGDINSNLSPSEAFRQKQTRDAGTATSLSPDMQRRTVQGPGGYPLLEAVKSLPVKFREGQGFDMSRPLEQPPNTGNTKSLLSYTGPELRGVGGARPAEAKKLTDRKVGLGKTLRSGEAVLDASIVGGAAQGAIGRGAKALEGGWANFAKRYPTAAARMSGKVPQAGASLSTPTLNMRQLRDFQYRLRKPLEKRVDALSDKYDEALKLDPKSHRVGSKLYDSHIKPYDDFFKSHRVGRHGWEPIPKEAPAAANTAQTSVAESANVARSANTSPSPLMQSATQAPAKPPAKPLSEPLPTATKTTGTGPADPYDPSPRTIIPKATKGPLKDTNVVTEPNLVERGKGGRLEAEASQVVDDAAKGKAPEPKPAKKVEPAKKIEPEPEPAQQVPYSEQGEQFRKANPLTTEEAERAARRGMPLYTRAKNWINEKRFPKLQQARESYPSLVADKEAIKNYQGSRRAKAVSIYEGHKTERAAAIPARSRRKVWFEQHGKTRKAVDYLLKPPAAAAGIAAAWEGGGRAYDAATGSKPDWSSRPLTTAYNKVRAGLGSLGTAITTPAKGNTSMPAETKEQAVSLAKGVPTTPPNKGSSINFSGQASQVANDKLMTPLDSSKGLKQQPAPAKVETPAKQPVIKQPTPAPSVESGKTAPVEGGKGLPAKKLKPMWGP